MNKRHVFFFILILACAVPSMVLGQLTSEHLFNSGEYNAESFRGARWQEDGVSYTRLELSGSGPELFVYDAQSGNRTRLVSTAMVTPEGSDEPLRIEDYFWSPDRSKLLVYTNSERVWRQNTRGDYWVLDLRTGSLRQLGVFADPSRMMFAKFSPDGNRVGYVYRNNVYVEEVSSGVVTALTTDGSVQIINGTFDWVYEEEFGLRDGFRWSPDGSSIAYWQLDASGIRDFLMINNTDSLYSFTIPIQYPKTGTTNSAARIGVVSASGGETKWFELSGDLRNNYPARMEWAANSSEILVQHLNRHQNTNEVTLVNVETGQKRIVFTETEEAWLDVVDDLKWLDSGNGFTWVSERSGWRHLYTVSRDGSTFVDVTPGDYDVENVVEIDADGGWVYFIASPENATQRYLYRASMDHPSPAERLTPADEPGWHSYQMAPGGRFAFQTYSTINMPPVYRLVSLPDHREIRTLVTNEKLQTRLDALGLSPVEFIRVDIGEVELDGYLIKPSNFDPTKKYPVLFHVYGEPAAQTATDSWKGSRGLWHQMIAEKGYIVLNFDNRGTPSPRGRNWRKIVYGSVGVLASADQAAVANVVASWPWIDGSKMAIWGWSGGGSMSLNAIFRYPDRYHTAMSVAPVPDQTLYDTIYQERYMSTPQDNPEGYFNGSPMNFAHQLEGNLLVIHGTGDDNVHYQGTERLINRLIEHNKPFTMMAYPNRSHGIFEGKNTTVHLFNLLERYLTENMPPVGNQ